MPAEACTWATSYGIDVFDDRLEIAFQAPMGGGSGSSPAISHDGRQVYALDEDGHVVAIDAESGEPIGDPLVIPETSEGFIVPTLDGSVFVTLAEGRQESALAALRRTALQIASSRAVMEKAAARGELDPADLRRELSRLVEVEGVLIQLSDTLRRGSLSEGERAGSESRLKGAQATLLGMAERLAPAASRVGSSEGRRIRNP